MRIKQTGGTVMSIRIALSRVIIVLPFLAAMVGMAVGNYLLVAGSMPDTSR
jgi:hypothetical protein